MTDPQTEITFKMGGVCQKKGKVKDIYICMFLCFYAI